MGMPDAGLVIGAGISLFGLGVAVHLSVDAWLRVRRFERESRAQDAAPRPDDQLAARLARIEQIVEVTSVEMERVAESQRYMARAITEQRPSAAPLARSPERVITPH